MVTYTDAGRNPDLVFLIRSQPPRRKPVTIDPSTFRSSLLPVFDRAMLTHPLDSAESHFRSAMDTRRHSHY